MMDTQTKQYLYNFQLWKQPDFPYMSFKLLALPDFTWLRLGQVAGWDCPSVDIVCAEKDAKWKYTSEELLDLCKEYKYESERTAYDDFLGTLASKETG